MAKYLHKEECVKYGFASKFADVASSCADYETKVGEEDEAFQHLLQNLDDINDPSYLKRIEIMQQECDVQKERLKFERGNLIADEEQQREYWRDIAKTLPEMKRCVVHHDMNARKERDEMQREINNLQWNANNFMTAGLAHAAELLKRMPRAMQAGPQNSKAEGSTTPLHVTNASSISASNTGLSDSDVEMREADTPLLEEKIKRKRTRQKAKKATQAAAANSEVVLEGVSSQGSSSSPPCETEGLSGNAQDLSRARGGAGVHQNSEPATELEAVEATNEDSDDSRHQATISPPPSAPPMPLGSGVVNTIASPVFIDEGHPDNDPRPYIYLSGERLFTVDDLNQTWEKIWKVLPDALRFIELVTSDAEGIYVIFKDSHNGALAAEDVRAECFGTDEGWLGSSMGDIFLHLGDWYTGSG